MAATEATGAAVRTGRPGSLADLVDPRANTLNFVRLVLAASVVFWHTYPINGYEFGWDYGRQVAGHIGVDGFFVISGFLLAGSWLHKPHLVSYAKNRLLRIMPAFWVCLVVVSLVIAPLSLLATGGDPADVLQGPHSAWRYITENAALSIAFHDVAGTPLGVPYEGVWNGSLWTLRWEAGAYVGLAVLGVLGLLRRRLVVLGLAVLLWLLTVGLAYGLVPDGYWVENGTRLAFVFVLGAVLQVYGDRVPAAGWTAGVAATLLALSPLLPDYRILGGPAVAYLVVWLGGRITHPALRLKDRDISYGLYIYAFPVQQSLALAGTPSWHPLLAGLVALVLTVPLAVASWVLVERPALRLKNRRLLPAHRPAPAAAGARAEHPTPGAEGTSP